MLSPPSDSNLMTQNCGFDDGVVKSVTKGVSLAAGAMALLAPAPLSPIFISHYDAAAADWSASDSADPTTDDIAAQHHPHHREHPQRRQGTSSTSFSFNRRRQSGTSQFQPKLKHAGRVSSKRTTISLDQPLRGRSSSADLKGGVGGKPIAAADQGCYRPSSPDTEPSRTITSAEHKTKDESEPITAADQGCYRPSSPDIEPSRTITSAEPKTEDESNLMAAAPDWGGYTWRDRYSFFDVEAAPAREEFTFFRGGERECHPFKAGKDLWGRDTWSGLCNCVRPDSGHDLPSTNVAERTET